MIGEFIASPGDEVRQFVSVLAYYLPRTMTFMVFFPILSKGTASQFVKLSVGSCLVLYPAFASTHWYVGGPNPPVFTLITFLSEVSLGALLGLTISMPYFAFKSVGALVDVYRGATFSAQVTGSDTSQEELPVEQLFAFLYSALIMAGPGLHAVTVHLLDSYLILPPGTLESASLQAWLTSMLRITADHVEFAVLLSGPILLAVLVVEFAMEIISAFTQQLQVYSLQYALRSVFGVAALLVLMHYAEDEILAMFRQYSESLYKLLGAIS
ncbi:MAG TPA: flagellar biosynthetic protein FliR [Limnobacter sp.]|uniref:EscT/YscT/HrcT family type III secretion system export apparatus protein n=1 Tax=Limnobacter sp. TaxID=2003368 RepID=UPI002E357BBD|nr:flagellar biosynthetic protein FliR [Limnobacter sp.]HEX5487447.1 flagellar biosynthetic protein FliR [Limnobacter sp.]